MQPEDIRETLQSLLDELEATNQYYRKMMRAASTVDRYDHWADRRHGVDYSIQTVYKYFGAMIPPRRE